MENKTIENIAICTAVFGAFVLIAYIIKKYDKIILKWKDISATFGMNSTTEAATETPEEASKDTPNKSSKGATKEAKTESRSKIEDSNNIELISKQKKTNEKSDPKPETSTKDLKPKFEVELPPASSPNITDFANIDLANKGMQTNIETIFADEFSVSKDARISNVANIDIGSQGGENNKTKFERKINIT